MLLLEMTLGEDGGWAATIPTLSPQLYEKALSRIRGFPQRTWRASHDKRYWAIPVTEPNIEYLRKKYRASEYEMDDEAKLAFKVLEKRYEVTAKKERRRWEYLFNDKVPTINFDTHFYINDGKDTTLDGLVPYDHQIVTLDAIHNAEFFALLMEQGTGKTPVPLWEAMAKARDKKTYPNGYKLLVMCPKSVRASWERTISMTMTQDIKLWIGRLNRGGTNKIEQIIDGLRVRADLKIWLISHESVRTVVEALEMVEFDMAILDESTRIKHGRTKRSKATRQVARWAKRRFILTGTPITNNVHDIYYQFDFLEPGCLGYTTHNAFKMRYEKTVRWKNQKKGSKIEELVGWQNLEELKMRMARFSFSVKKKDCLDLPEKIWMDPIAVELTGEQRRLYESMQATFFAEMEATAGFIEEGGGDLSNAVTAQIVLTQMLRLRQIVNGFIKTEMGEIKWIPGRNPKLEALMELIEEHPKDQKMIVWCDFIPTIERIRDELERRGIGYADLYGGSKDRDTIEERFNNDDNIRILVGNPAAGGMGITLVGSKECPCTACVYYSSDWNMEYRAQSEDRPHRIGMHAPVTYYDIVGANTIDEIIADALAMKKTLSEYCRNFKTLRDRLLKGPEYRFLTLEIR